MKKSRFSASQIISILNKQEQGLKVVAENSLPSNRSVTFFIFRVDTPCT
nr:hypothetical protein [Fodinibius roseus]